MHTSGSAARRQLTGPTAELFEWALPRRVDLAEAANLVLNALQFHSWKKVNMASISTDEERTDEEALLFVLLVRRRRRLAAEFGKEIGLEDGREGSIWHFTAELDRPHTRSAKGGG